MDVARGALELTEIGETRQLLKPSVLVDDARLGL